MAVVPKNNKLIANKYNFAILNINSGRPMSIINGHESHEKLLIFNTYTERTSVLFRRYSVGQGFIVLNWIIMIMLSYSACFV